MILRHKPEVIGITLDEHGWAKVDELIKGVNKVHPLDMETLEEIVRKALRALETPVAQQTVFE